MAVSTRGFENLTEGDAMRLGRRRTPSAQTAIDVALSDTRSDKPSKYRNVRCEIDGEKFDSKREAAHWQTLKIREQLGEITDIKRQVPFSLMCPTPGDDEEVCRYFADFTYRDVVHGRPMQLHVVDAKGKRTPMYQLKKKWLKIQDGVTIEEV
jgi:Protein of unknown function (DUF1064)